MDSRCGYSNQGGSTYWRPYRSEEFHEEDVWGVIKDDRQVGLKIDKPSVPTSPLSISRRLPSAARMIPGAHKHQHHDNDEPKLVQHSAPVSIPDWSKIYGNSPKRDNGSSASPHDHDCNRHNNDYYNAGYDGAIESDDDYEDYDDNDGDGRLPPHEWLAKKLASSQISSFSVCEGAGRTLKGRDLSRVRNAVLSKTGFI